MLKIIFLNYSNPFIEILLIFLSVIRCLSHSKMAVFKQDRGSMGDILIFVIKEQLVRKTEAVV